MSIIRTALFLALVLCIPNYLYAQDVVLYGAASQSCSNGGNPGSGQSFLYMVNPDTGDMQPIGAIGFDGVTGLESLPDGRLIGTARQGDTSVLIRINPDTGQGFLIGTLGNIDNPGECARFPDLAYDNATETLYATGFFCNGLSRTIFTIDPDTAQATLIGETLFGGGGLGLAMRSDGTLFHSSLSGPNLSFYTINLNTGNATLVGTVDANIPPVPRLNVNSMDFHPITGQLFGSSKDADSPGPGYLVTINEDLPSVSLVGQGVDCFDALVFATEPEPVPALSTWGIMAVVAAFAVASIFYIRKRRAVA